VTQDPAAGAPGEERAVTASHAAAGTVLVGRYRVVRLLGRGGMGSVFLAEHVYLGRPTAVKVLRAELCTDPDAEARFRREALLAARLTHPNIAQIYDFDRTTAGEFLIAMEYVDGETIAQRMRRAGVFPLSQAAQVLHGVAEGLDRAHVLGILHRDLKPENVMLAREGAVKLLDFGVARSVDTSAEITSSGEVVGTPAYMSPEQLSGEPLGPATDIYSLGTVFYEMISGQQTHVGATFAEFRMRRMLQPPTALHLLRPDCPQALSDVVARALDMDPRRRWPSATAFAEAVLEQVSERPSRVVASPAPVAGPDAVERWEAHFETLRLAGRDREVREVRDAWAAARAGRTIVLWIEGDEGCGKSSFFDLAEREARGDGRTALVGRGYEVDAVRPYGAWIPMLRSALELEAGRERPWPAITALTDADPATSVTNRAALYDEVGALVRAAAQRGALFVGLEDLDRCDPASIGLLGLVANDVTGVPLLLAVTAHTGGSGAAEAAVRDVRERLRGRDGVVWIALRPLSYETVGDWLKRALGHEPPVELLQYIYGNTEGNAFFIEQVVRTMIERGDLGRLSDTAAVVALANAPPPEAVADVVERRLKAMSPAAREILQFAAVIGQEFDVDLVLALASRAEAAVLDALDEAQAAGILTPVTRVGGDWYRFTHNKIAQVLAQSLNQRRRRQLHQKTAEVLSARPGTPQGVLAWHWYNAGDLAKASKAARAAAHGALDVHAYDDALTFGAMAAETCQSPQEKVEAHELRGDALRRLDRPGDAAAAYARARLALGGSGAERPGLRRKELRCALAAGTVSVVAALAEARRLVEAADAAERAACEVLLAEALLATGSAEEAATVAQGARAGARARGDRPREADALLALGTAQLTSHAPAQANATAREAYALYDALRDPYGAACAGLLQGSAAVAAGQAGTADQALALALGQAERCRVTRLIREIKDRRVALKTGGS
jgi:predicted Ser/Thr protein kinase